MLPDIIQGGQTNRVITTSIGIQAVAASNDAVTFTGDDKRRNDHPVVTIDRTQEVPHEVWKTLSKSRKARIWKWDALSQAYEPRKATLMIFHQPTTSQAPAEIPEPPPPAKRAKMIVEEDSTTLRSPDVRETITIRLMQVFDVDLDSIPRYEKK